MIFEQYELGCLSLFSYLIGDETSGRAVVVDPQRDVGAYLADAERHGLAIERVIETHVHADFVSGHLELAERTGAAVSYGAGAKVDFPIDELEHGRRIDLGRVSLEIRATPGHTPESISIVVRDGDEIWGVLTGDTLFIGDVGRPDLLAAGGIAPEELAAQLFRSLHEQLLTLPDDCRVFPAHGAGSACGRNMSPAHSSTIGEQRATNHALQPTTEAAFVAAVTEGQPLAPPYFAFAADANRHAHALLAEGEAPPPLSATDAVARARAGAALLDCRAAETFASGHLVGSVNVGIDGRFAEYAGDVVRPDQDIVLVTDPGRETEARTRLARIGFDRVVAHVADLERALLEHPALAATAPRLVAADAAAWRDDAQVVDVRNPGEVADGTVEGSVNIPLARLLERMDELDRDVPVVVYCAGGYRSSVAASLLRANGFGRVADVLGGYDAWRAAA